MAVRLLGGEGGGRPFSSRHSFAVSLRVYETRHRIHRHARDDASGGGRVYCAQAL